MIRTEAAVSVSRFCELIGVPRRTYHHWLARHRVGNPTKGPWPAPVVDRIEPEVAKYATEWAAWGHRKVWALMGHDGHDVGSASSVARAMARRGLLQPVAYQAERRQLAQARRAVFVDPPTRRNRVWQMDFSEYETSTGGIWRLGGVVDYWAKQALACRVAATQTAPDLIAAIETAIDEAEALLGHTLIEDCVTGDGEIQPLAIVTDNGAAMRSVRLARWFDDRPHLVHVRTRHRSPQTNGVIERFFQSIKYEHLYRYEIGDGDALADHVAGYLTTYNQTRPHEAIGWQRPQDRYLTAPTNPTLKPSEPEPEQDS